MLFVCYRCECVDDSDLAFIGGVVPEHPANQLCSLCMTGSWHDRFPHQPYDPKRDLVGNKPTGIGLG